MVPIREGNWKRAGKIVFLPLMGAVGPKSGYTPEAGAI
jgi:hypothetical protein